MSKTAILAIARAPVSALDIRSCHLAYTLFFFDCFFLSNFIYKEEEQGCIGQKAFAGRTS
jgi:hypothetical protein